jgi:hypothetical protein
VIYKRNKVTTISIPCDCWTETIEIEKWDDDHDDFFINFKVNSFSSGQSVRWIIKRRLQLAWLALRKGNYIHQEISLTRDKMIELRDNINEILG